MAISRLMVRGEIVSYLVQGLVRPVNGICKVTGCSVAGGLVKIISMAANRRAFPLISFVIVALARR